MKIKEIGKIALAKLNNWIGERAVPRAIQLHKQAFLEEQKPIPKIHQPKLHLPLVLHYPRSFIVRTANLDHSKKRDYNFMGALFNENVYERRKWIIDFAQQHFTDHSYYCITDASHDYQPLGNYDQTLSNLGKRFIPRKVAGDKKSSFDEAYFKVMLDSKYTLCPAGDAWWSMRFFESIMCKSIPILESPDHAWRSRFERMIGYKFYTTLDQVEYREDWIEENYSKFLEYQTFLSRNKNRSVVLLSRVEEMLLGIDNLAKSLS
ncbi:MAG: exostosin family protein [Cyanobacteria bacterium P01_H01_bin.162]